MHERLKLPVQLLKSSDNNNHIDVISPCHLLQYLDVNGANDRVEVFALERGRGADA